MLLTVYNVYVTDKSADAFVALTTKKGLFMSHKNAFIFCLLYGLLEV